MLKQLIAILICFTSNLFSTDLRLATLTHDDGGAIEEKNDERFLPGQVAVEVGTQGLDKTHTKAQKKPRQRSYSIGAPEVNSPEQTKVLEIIRMLEDKNREKAELLRKKIYFENKRAKPEYNHMRWVIPVIATSILIQYAYSIWDTINLYE